MSNAGVGTAKAKEETSSDGVVNLWVVVWATRKEQYRERRAQPRKSLVTCAVHLALMSMSSRQAAPDSGVTPASVMCSPRKRPCLTVLPRCSLMSSYKRLELVLLLSYGMNG